jgi:ATP/maltotriose-dependent transcriptional regulator MalT
MVTQPRLSPGIPEGPVQNGHPAPPALGRRRQVLRLIAAGRSNQRIAPTWWWRSTRSKRHVSHVLGKLGAANRTEAAAEARQLGLIP